MAVAVSTVNMLESLVEAFLDHIISYKDYSPATAQAYERDCTRLIEFLRRVGGPEEPADIGPKHVRLFLASLSHLSPATMRRTLYGVSSFFRYLVDMEIIARNPAASVDAPKAKHKLPQVPSRSHCRRLLEACDSPSESAMIGLLLFAGLRRSEVLGLNVADVAADISSLRIRGKGGHERDVPVSSELRDILNDYLAWRTATESPALLLNAAGKRMAVTTFYRLFRRILRRAGLGDAGITPHSLRHSFATQLVRAGVDVATISELLGHSGIAVTSVYLHASTETKRAAVERLCIASETTEVADQPQSC